MGRQTRISDYSPFSSLYPSPGMVCMNQCRVGYLAKSAKVALLWVHLWCSPALHHLDLSDAMVTEDTHKHMHTLTHAHIHTVFTHDICACVYALVCIYNVMLQHVKMYVHVRNIFMHTCVSACLRVYVHDIIRMYNKYIHPIHTCTHTCTHTLPL
jgi:hypothetical protein